MRKLKLFSQVLRLIGLMGSQSVVRIINQHISLYKLITRSDRPARSVPSEFLEVNIITAVDNDYYLDLNG